MLRAELPLLCNVQALSLSQWYATLVDGGGDTKEAFGRWESATRTAISLRPNWVWHRQRGPTRRLWSVSANSLQALCLGKHEPKKKPRGSVPEDRGFKRVGALGVVWG
jgi:hypothetical protein